MFIRNYDDSFHDSEFLGLKKDYNYWFPHAFKYVAWFIVVGSVVSSTVILIVYGMSFGMIKTYLWATAFVAAFLLCVFVTEPVRILVFTFIDSLFLKNRFEDIRYNIELRNLTVDVIAYLVFMIIVLNIIFISKAEMSFYHNKAVSELILSGNYTNSLPLKAIDTYGKFVEYVNETLLPALLLESPASAANKKLNETPKREIRSWKDSPQHKPSLSKVTKRRIPDELKNLNYNIKKSKNVFEKGWTMNNNFKLLGRPRLRQVRVKGTYKQLKKIKARNVELAPELNLFNVEKGNFTLRWGPPPALGLTESQKLPWTYQSAWETGTVPVFGKYFWYPGGGYILDLAREINDARIVLEFLDAFEWVDVKTRAIFIEFTMYNVNTNLFSIVSLIIENSATGYMIPSHQIHTCKFIFVAPQLEYISLIITALFTLLLFFLLLRESLRIHRTSFKIYIGRTFALLDLAVVLFGALCLIFIIIRNYYVSHLLKKLEKADNNEFVAFTYAAFWYSWSVNIEAIMICLASFKFVRLQTFRATFFQFQLILSLCYQHFVHLNLLLIVFITTFAYFFYLKLMYYSEKFSNLGNSLLTLFGRAVARDDTFNLIALHKASLILTPLFLWLFIASVSILLVNVFVAVICLYFHVVRQKSFEDKYNVLEFIKFYLTKSRQNDILRLKEDIKNNDKHFDDFSVLRLRGGGRLSWRSKIKKKKKNETPEENKKKTKRGKDEEETEPNRIMAKDFITENAYSTTRYMHLEGIRAAAMRNLMVSFLADDTEEMMNFRENALKALFCYFISREEGRKGKKLNEDKSYYFSGVNNSETEIFDRRIFQNMKKVVEDLGKEKDWFMEDALDEEITSCENILMDLDKRLCRLLIKKHFKK